MKWGEVFFFVKKWKMAGVLLLKKWKMGVFFL